MKHIWVGFRLLFVDGFHGTSISSFLQPWRGDVKMRFADIDSVAEFESLVDRHMTELDAKSSKLLGVLFMREEQSLAKDIAASLLQNHLGM